MMLNTWPVIVRELRAECRRPFNYWLRVIGAAAALVIFALTVLAQRHSFQDLGFAIFSQLNLAIFCGIWVFVPLLTADCISQERREGTLGLLFLTPLTALGITLGKSAVHLVRASSALIVVLPVLVLPMFVGGVSWRDAVLALSLNVASLFLALAAGLLATSVTRDWIRALVLAELLGAFFAWELIKVHWMGFQWLDFHLGPQAAFFAKQSYHIDFWQLVGSRPASPAAFVGACVWLFTGMGISSHWNMVGSWRGVWQGFPPKFKDAWLAWGGMLAAAALLGLLLAMLVAAWIIRRSWRDQPPSRGQARAARFFCEPRYWRAIFRGKIRRTLERNPIGWLEQYSSSARLTKWGWCLFLILVECFLVADASLNSLLPGNILLALLLGLSLAFGSAASFRRERETGAMELLLVTPLRVGQVIWGRVRGVWRQFLPALVLMLLVWLHMNFGLRSELGWARESMIPAVFPVLILSSFLFVPAIGLCFSMYRLNVLTAWIGTAGVGFLLPLAAGLAPLLLARDFRQEVFVSGWLLAQVGAAGIAITVLRWRLVSRRFVLS